MGQGAVGAAHGQRRQKLAGNAKVAHGRAQNQGDLFGRKTVGIVEPRPIFHDVGAAWDASAFQVASHSVESLLPGARPTKRFCADGAQKLFGGEVAGSLTEFMYHHGQGRRFMRGQHAHPVLGRAALAHWFVDGDASLGEDLLEGLGEIDFWRDHAALEYTRFTADENAASDGDAGLSAAGVAGVHFGHGRSLGRRGHGSAQHHGGGRGFKHDPRRRTRGSCGGDGQGDDVAIERSRGRGRAKGGGVVFLLEGRRQGGVVEGACVDNQPTAHLAQSGRAEAGGQPVQILRRQRWVARGLHVQVAA